MQQSPAIFWKDCHAKARETLFKINPNEKEKRDLISSFLQESREIAYDNYQSYLYNPHKSALNVKLQDPIYSKQSKNMDGRQIIQKYFDHTLTKDPRVFIIGEDVGQLGGVNLEFEGLQEKNTELLE